MDNLDILIAKIIRKINAPKKINQIYNDRRHYRIEKKLNQYFTGINYSEFPINHTVPKIIWIFWWQGASNMPSIVKKCYQSIIKNKNNAEVILITKDNIRNYANLPEYIYTKLNDSKITLTHFSDILRFNLLNNYGGLWIDATIYAVEKIPDEYFQKIFTCCGYVDKEHFFVAQGRWTGFLIGGEKNNSLFQFMNNFFLEYWKKNDQLIDYFLIDYALDYAWKKNIGTFRDFCNDNIGKYNKNLFELEPMLNKKFDINLYKKICQDTQMFKLTYKHKLKLNGTFADYIINNEG